MEASSRATLCPNTFAVSHQGALARRLVFFRRLSVSPNLLASLSRSLIIESPVDTRIRYSIWNDTVSSNKVVIAPDWRRRRRPPPSSLFLWLKICSRRNGFGSPIAPLTSTLTPPHPTWHHAVQSDLSLEILARRRTPGQWKLWRFLQCFTLVAKADHVFSQKECPTL